MGARLGSVLIVEVWLVGLVGCDVILVCATFGWSVSGFV